MINFAKGHPNNSLLPVEEMQEIFTRVTSDSQSGRLQKSLNYLKSDRGDPDLLAELASFMDRNTQKDDTGTPPTAKFALLSHPPKTDLFITHGVSHGLDILCTTQTKTGDVVLVERPTYFLVNDIFKSHGLKVQSLPMKPTGGVDVDGLEQLLVSGKIRPPRMIYIIPTHQNPTASTMSVEDRWKLAILAREYSILVAADEVYHLLDWRKEKVDGPRPARMALLDSMLLRSERLDESRLGCCVTVSSFTKIFAPGVRCGWVEGPKDIIDGLVSLGYIQSQGGCAPFVGEIFRAALSAGISDKVLRNLNTAYEERCLRLCELLQSESGIQFDTVPHGGYFVWIAFSGVDDTSIFLEYCETKGVKFLPGSHCDFVQDDNGAQSGLPDDACRRWARLCFADLDLEDLEQGAQRLISCYREYLAGSKTDS